jgi:16S rRNA (cytosine1402-N4)-methyltransferase
MSEAAPRHVPVLIEEVLSALALSDGALVVDGTFGAGGYTRRFLDAGAKVIAIDRDPSAVRAGMELVMEANGRLTLIEGRFGELGEIARGQGLSAIDGVALDIGVSSMQIDDAHRGFSLRQDAALDMRMESAGRSAADILADAEESEIADILYHYGEERASRRIARAIVADRKATPFVSTRQLAGLIERVAPARPGELTHPATRSFQALRIAVNDELGELLRGLSAAERLLKPGGRLAVVTFHSLEDRIVKQFLARRTGRGEAASRLLPGEPKRHAASFRAPAKQPILPSEAEIRRNSRARPAKLRWAERTDAPALEVEAALEALTSAGSRERRR